MFKPALVSSLKTYTRQTFLSDLFAGLTVEAISEAAQETPLLQLFRPAAAALIQGTNSMFPGEDEEGTAEPGKN